MAVEAKVSNLNRIHSVLAGLSVSVAAAVSALAAVVVSVGKHVSDDK